MLNNTEYIQILQEVATKCEKPGVLVLSSFGQDPNTGGNLSPKNSKIDINHVPSIYNIIVQHLEPHRNIYLGLHVMRQGLAPKQRGGIKDIIAVLGFVADFDDAQAPDYMNRLPQGWTPSYVLETSKNRFQCGFLLDAPLYDLDKAQKIATRLKNYCKCDHGTADIAHVWRIPGTLNWPNQKKVREGRSHEPQPVKIITEI